MVLRGGLSVLILLVATAAGEVNNTAPIVRLREGLISGKVLVSEKGRKYYAYTGIPYAQSPTGDLRFMFPKRLPESAWDGVKKCVSYAPKCPQLTFPERHYEGDEDCLFLNVYTHRLEDTDRPLEELAASLRPVLFWIHGGGFQHGSADYDAVGPERFMDNSRDLVLVTANYRLNALGFLSIGEDPAMGNAGLKDQYIALSWVQSNIAQFGGHPRRVTLGGNQAGGVAAHLHALSPLSSGDPDMFLQTFSMSGNALVPWAVIPTAEARRRAFRLGKRLGCAGQELVRCLRAKPVEDIVRLAEDVLDWRSDISFPFVPSVENFDGYHRPFMLVHPREVLRRNHSGVHQKAWLTGVTTHEGLPFALQLMVYGGLREDLQEHFEERVWDFLGMAHMTSLGSDERRAAGRRLWQHYMQGQGSISLATLPGIIDLASDAVYLHSLREAVLFHSLSEKAARAPVYVYRFGFSKRPGRRKVLGVPPGVDVELLFPAVFAGNKTSLKGREKQIADKVLRLLSNFIAEGKPTPEQEVNKTNLKWPAVLKRNITFLDISEEGHISINKEGFYPERLNIWHSLHQNMEKSLDADHVLSGHVWREEL